MHKTLKGPASKNNLGHIPFIFAKSNYTAKSDRLLILELCSKMCNFV